MRCLKVPNTKAFLEVTSIADALQLHKAISKRGAASFRTENDEEFEDAQGNVRCCTLASLFELTPPSQVYNRKTYMDLTRQGLL